MRMVAACSVAWLAFVSACAASDPDPNPATGGASPASSAGANSTPGGAGAASGAAGAGGAYAAAGGPSAASGGAAGTPAPRGGAGGGDNGNLFDPGSSVPFVPAGGGGGMGPSVIVGQMATANLNGSVSGTVIFTQNEADVSVVVKLTKCPDGTHGIAIRRGLSCDSELLEGDVWERGQLSDGTSTVNCSKNSATFSYTRKSTDAKYWVINGMPDVDPSTHVVVVTTSSDPQSSKLVCGNFF